MLTNCADNNPGGATAPEKLCRESRAREPGRYVKAGEARSELWRNAGLASKRPAGFRWLTLLRRELA
jgi:hypothetical protein